MTNVTLITDRLDVEVREFEDNFSFVYNDGIFIIDNDTSLDTVEQLLASMGV